MDRVGDRFFFLVESDNAEFSTTLNYIYFRSLHILYISLRDEFSVKAFAAGNKF